MSIVDWFKEKIEAKIEQRKEINAAKKDIQKEATTEYIKGMKEEKLKQAYQKGVDSVSKKRKFMGSFIKPFTPEELSSMHPSFTSPNYQTPNTNSTFSNNSISTFKPIVMTKEFEAIEKIREGK